MCLPTRTFFFPNSCFLTIGLGNLARRVWKLEYSSANTYAQFAIQFFPTRASSRPRRSMCPSVVQCWIGKKPLAFDNSNSANISFRLGKKPWMTGLTKKVSVTPLYSTYTPNESSLLAFWYLSSRSWALFFLSSCSQSQLMICLSFLCNNQFLLQTALTRFCSEIQ